MKALLPKKHTRRGHDDDDDGDGGHDGNGDDGGVAGDDGDGDGNGDGRPWSQSGEFLPYFSSCFPSVSFM